MIVQSIPAGSVPKIPAQVFKTDFGSLDGLVFSDSVYSIDKTIDFLEMAQSSIYLIENFSVSANISDAGFYESIIEVPEVQLIQKTTSQKFQQFPNNIPIQTLGDQKRLSGYFFADGGDTLQIKVTGVLSQIIETIDLESIDFVVSATIYRIMDRAFISRLQSTISNPIGY